MKKVFLVFVLIPILIFAQLETSFEGIQYSGKKPPDPVIAVGVNHIVLAVNEKFEVFSKTGTSLGAQTYLSFFSSVSPTPQESIFDPKIVYDQFSDRYILLALNRNPSNRFLLAVTETNDPTGNWFKYALENESTFIVDYPGLGYNETSIILTSHSLDNASGIQSLPEIVILNKEEVYENDINYRKDFVDFSPYPSKLKPARVIGTSNSTKVYLIDTKSPSEVRIWSITNPLGGSSAALAIEATKTLGSYSNPADAVQKGTSILIEVDKVSSSISDIVYQDDILYGAYTIANTFGNGSSIKYFAIDIDDNFNVITNGLIENTDTYYYYPVTHPDGSGNMVMVFNQSSSNDYVGIAYTTRFTSKSTHEPIDWLKTGESPYTAAYGDRYRWGDYSGIAMDPNNSSRIWIYGEWAKTTDYWSTWVGEIKTSETKDFFFTNKYLNANLGGTLTANNELLISGESTPLETGVNYEATTNNERFPNWNYTGINYKQNNWNDDREEYYLKYSFEAKGTKLNHKAVFEELKYSKVAISAEGISQPDDGDISFNDPWYIKSDGTQHYPSNPSDLFWVNSTNGYYEPNGKYSASEKGVFLEQGYDPVNDVWTTPYYSVKATSPQPIYVQGKNREFYFQNWEADPVGGATFQNSGSLETPVVFNQAGATAKAVMKGTGLSNNSSAYTHNNQRKVVKTSNGNLHMVYESMGHIWHEMSTDDGDNWTIMNSGAPIDDSGDLAKSPSVTLDYNNTDYFFLVYQEVYLATDDNQIVVKRISETGLEDWTNNVDLVMSSNSIDLEPVVACNYSNLLVVYRVEDNDIPGSSLGLNYTFYSRTGNPMVFTKQVIGGLVTGTYSTSINPALASRQYPSSVSMYYLAWKQGSSIQFTKIDVVNNSSLTFNTIETPTSGSGNSDNYSPSITANDSYVYLVWRGKRKEYIAGVTNKVSAIGSYVYIDRVNYRMRDYYGNWGTLKRYGSDVSDPSINSAGSPYMYCWSENNGASNKFVRSDETTVKYFSTNGEDLQSGNGLVNLGQMQAVSFNKTTLPYDFNPTSLLSDIGLNKTESIVMNYGREGIVNVDGAEFTFTIGDVLLDGEAIDFVSVTDSTVAGNLTELNSYLKTNPFNITSGSELMMSLMFGVVNDSLAKTKLTEEDYVNFKMELFDSKTKEVIGSFDDVTFTEGNVEQYANISYLLETDGIGNREVELRLVVDDNVGASYSIARIYSDKEVLTKSSSKSISYQGSLEVKDYALSQNYPNPFNPSTTIKYQIPEDGFVSVKIYDITGSKVKTLVNRAQTKGRYQVTFDASNLSSGVYFYRIRSGSFVKTMKMILLR